MFTACGPTRMIDDFLAVTQARDPATVHYERFSATQQAATEGGFDVVLHKSGTKYRVEAGKTILDVLLDNNVAVPYSCCNGVCGSCRTGIIDGQADHRDDFLSDEAEAGQPSNHGLLLRRARRHWCLTFNGGRQGEETVNGKQIMNYPHKKPPVNRALAPETTSLPASSRTCRTGACSRAIACRPSATLAERLGVGRNAVRRSADSCHAPRGGVTSELRHLSTPYVSRRAASKRSCC
ncbi:flavin reductase family protein [Cupriavidus basilensis]